MTPACGPQQHRQPAQAPVLRTCACSARPACGDGRPWRTDPYVGVIQEAAAAVPVVTYALYNRDADVHVERLRLNMEETQARARARRQRPAALGGGRCCWV